MMSIAPIHSRMRLFFIVICLSTGPMLQGFGSQPEAAAAEVVDRIVAVVNDEVITQRDFLAYYERYAEKIAEAGYSPEKVREQMLRQMIDERLAQQEINRIKLKVSEAEIDGAVEQIKQVNRYSDEALLQALAAEGLTLEAYRSQLKEQILRAKLINQEVKSRIVITESDIKAYYDGHPDEFQGKNMVRLRNILIPADDTTDPQNRSAARQQMETLIEKLEAGESFEALARRYTIDSLAASGGDLGWFAMDKLSDQIQEAISDLKPGEWTPVIDTEKGYQIFFLEEARAESVKPLESVYDQIEKKLYDGIVEERYRQWVQQLRSQAYIRVVD